MELRKDEISVKQEEEKFIVTRLLEEVYDAEEYLRNCIKLEVTTEQLTSNLEEQKKLNEKWMVLKKNAEIIRSKEVSEADEQAKKYD